MLSSMNASLARPVQGLRSSALPARRPARQMRVQAAASTGGGFDSKWLNPTPIVPVLGFFGWTAPTCIGVPVLGGSSLFGEFLKSIGENLSHFPQGPALQDKFWLYFAVYHVGLFTTLLLGQIGVNGKKQGLW